jgi:hypothetical protein
MTVGTGLAWDGIITTWMATHGSFGASDMATSAAGGGKGLGLVYEMGGDGVRR